MTDPHALLAGRYRLVRVIAAGGMGVVWEGWDERLRRPVAVKELRRQDGVAEAEAENAKDRAMREARITARLHHPHAVPVFDVVEDDGRPCLIMQYLPSTTLSAVIRERGPLPTAEVARIGSEIASALAAAHKIGIVHRDVKPGNILIGEDGAAMISDFGISRALGDATLTRTGLVHGTPAFLAPEVARGQDSTFASDVFSLGSTLYMALEGLPPFGMDNNSIALLHKVARGDFAPPPHGDMLTPLVIRMLAADPGARPRMRSVASQLAGLHTLLEPAVADEGTDPLPRPLAAPVAAIAAPVAAAAVATAAESAGQEHDEVPEPEPAGSEQAGQEPEPAGSEQAGQEPEPGRDQEPADLEEAEPQPESEAPEADPVSSGPEDEGEKAGPEPEPKPVPLPAPEPSEEPAAAPPADQAEQAESTPIEVEHEEPSPLDELLAAAAVQADQRPTRAPRTRAGRASRSAGPRPAPVPAVAEAPSAPEAARPVGAGFASPPGPPTATAPPSRTAPPPRGRPRRRALVIAASVVVVAAIALIVAWFVRGQLELGGDGARAGAASESPAPSTEPKPSASAREPSATPAPAASTPAATPPPATQPPATPAPTAPPAQQGPATAEQLAQAITGYYGLMPGNRDAAWNRLTADYQQNHAGGRGGYEEFWSPIGRVEVSDVGGSAPDAAEATITYFYDDGRVVVERTSFRLVNEDGILKIADSNVLSSVTR